MTKQFFASLLMLAIMFTFSLNVNAQESEDYNMWESIMLTPDYTQLKTLQTNMRKHNQTYHKDGIHRAEVYNITSGPNAGNIIWQMGPTMFKHLDTRPSTGGHDEDWRDNIMPYIKKMHTSEYWTQDDKISNVSMLNSDNMRPILLVRYFEVSDDHGYTMNSFFERVSKTLKSIEGEHPWGLYYNDFLQGDLGRHVATVAFFKNWAELDEDIKFKDAFIKLYSENMWEEHQKTRDDTFTNIWDEFWVYNQQMSGQ